MRNIDRRFFPPFRGPQYSHHLSIHHQRWWRQGVASLLLVTLLFVGATGGFLRPAAAAPLHAPYSSDKIIAWGSNSFGQVTVPADLNHVIAVAAGSIHSVALKDDGTVVAWGDNTAGQSNVPAGLSNVIAIDAGQYYNLALKADGTVVGWGDRFLGGSIVPAGLNNVIAIAASGYHSMALKADGTVVAWGFSNGPATVPAGLSNVIAIDAGALHGLALKADGTVVAWNGNNGALTAVPAGLNNVIAIAAGDHSLALKADGTVVAWGYNGQGQATVPAGLSDVIAIAAGGSHSLALKANGTVVAWGANNAGQAAIPAGLNNVIAIAAGGRHNLVLGGPAPKLDVQGNGVSIANNDSSPSSSDGTSFGLVKQPASRQRTFVLRNSGDADLRINSVTLDSNQSGAFRLVTLPSFPLTITVGMTQPLVVDFTPTTLDAVTATVQIASNDKTANPYAFVIGGAGTDQEEPEIVIEGNGEEIAAGDTTPSSADATDLGNVTTGSSLVRSFTIGNLGLANLTGLSVQMSGDAAFQLSNTPAATLAPGDVTTVQVTFAPTRVGRMIATVSIANNDRDESPYTFVLSGAGVMPEIDLQGNGVSIVSGDNAPSSSDQTDFGTVTTGQNLVRTFTIRNSGQAALTGVAATVSGNGAFSLTSAPATTVNAGSSTTLRVTFAPTSSGRAQATVRIANSDSDENPYTFVIGGTGATPILELQGNGQPIANGDSSPNLSDGTDFGGVARQVVQRKSFTLHNRGDADLSISNITFSGAQQADFSLVTPPRFPVIIAPGAVQTITVQLQPSADGVRTANLVINSNDPANGAYRLALQNRAVVCTLYPGGTTPLPIPDQQVVAVAVAVPNIGLVSDVNVRNVQVQHTYDSDLQVGLLSPAGQLVVLADGRGGAGRHYTNTSFDDAASALISASSAPFNGSYRPDNPLAVLNGSKSQGQWRLVFFDTAIGDTGTLYGWSLELCSLVAPSLAVQGNGRVIANGDASPSSTDQTYVGAALSGSSLVRTFTISNTGAANLMSIATSVSGNSAFRISKAPTAAVAPSGSSTFQLTFTPSSVGIVTATVRLASNDGNTNPYTFVVQGAGLETPPPFLTGWGSEGAALRMFDTPFGVAVDRNDNLYVADTFNHRIQMFDNFGKLLTQWGTQGSGAGQFATPFGVAVDRNGNVYVGDTLNNRIQKFTRYGQFLSQWGAEGSGAGQFGNPQGLATDSSGNVYVADSLNNRIQKFTSNGAFVSQWGAKGSGAGQFDGPANVAVDSRDPNQIYVYVVDAMNHRIQKFTGDGVFLAQWGSYGNEVDQLYTPYGVAVDRNGNVYVADSFNHRIQKFSNNGALLAQWGGAGVNDGRFFIPGAIATNRADQVIVADTFNHRVQLFGQAGPVMAVRINGLTIDDEDTTPSRDDGTDFGRAIVESDQFATFAINNRGTADLTGITVSVSGDSAFSVKEQPRTQINSGGETRFTLQFSPHSRAIVTTTVSIASNDSRATPYTFVVQGFGLEQPPGFLSILGLHNVVCDGPVPAPTTLGFDSHGNIFQSDAFGHCVYKFNHNGDFLTQWGNRGSGNGQFVVPTSLAVDRDDNVYVTDAFNHRIQKFDNNGNFLTKWGSLGSGPGRFDFPMMIGIDRSNLSADHLIIVDTSKLLMKYDTNGNFIANLGPLWGQSARSARYGLAAPARLAAGVVEFTNPTGAATDSSGNVYVIDNDSGRLQKFDRSGAYLTEWATGVSSSRQVNRQTALAVDSRDPNNVKVYIADAVNNRIRQFDGVGTLLSEWGSTGSGEGEFNNPTGLAVDENGYLYVVDSGNQRIQIFGNPPSAPVMAVQGNGVRINSGDSSPSLIDQSDLGGANTGSSLARTFTIRNNGTADLTGVAVNVNGNAAVSVSAQPAATVSAGSSSTFQLTLAPTAAGAVTATVTISSNDSLAKPYIFVVQGAGFTTATPRSVVQGNGITISSGDTTPSHSDQTIIGGVTVGGVVSRTFTIYNRGTANLTGVAASVAGGAMQITRQPAATISAGGSSTFVVTFAPGSVGISDATVSIASNDSAANPYTFAVQGSGLETAPPFLTQWGTAGSAAGQFADPYSVATDSLGNLYVVDGNNHRIQKFGPNGNFLTQWGVSASGSSEVAHPYAVAVDSRNANAIVIYVVDTSNHMVKKFDSSGNLVAFWGAKGSSAGQFSYPAGIAVDGSGNLYVADSYNQRIQKFNSTGAFLAQWGASGSANGEFLLPTGIAVDSSGNVYVADSGNRRIQKFDSAGAFLAQWGSMGSGAGQFSNPAGVAVDRDGNLYVTDTVNQRLQKFTNSGRLLAQWGGFGSTDGEFDQPFGVATDSRGNVYIADTGNQRIQLFGPAAALAVVGNNTALVNHDTTPATNDDTSFGSVATGNAPLVHTFTIRNNGAGTLTLANAAQASVNGSAGISVTNAVATFVTISDSNAFTVTTQPANSVAPGGETSVAIGFAPKTAGIYTATVRIASNDPAAPIFTFVVQGTATQAPQLRLTGPRAPSGTLVADTANGANFGNVISNSAVTRTYTLSNTGNADLTISAITLNGGQASAFAIGGVNLPLTIAAGGSSTFTLRLTPSATGLYSTTVRIASNDPSQNLLTFGVQAIAKALFAADINVAGNGVSIASGDSTPTDSDGGNFGPITVTTTITRAYTISNTGNADLAISAITLNGGQSAFSLSRASVPFTLTTGSSRTFLVRFAPSTTGLFTSTVQITSNDGDEAPFTFVLSGQGSLPPEIDVQGNGVSIANGDSTPATIDDTAFTAGIDSVLNRTFTIHNLGDWDLTDVAVTLAGDSAFQLTRQPTTTISGRASDSFQVVFTPTTQAVVSATITITSSDSDENPYTFVVNGTGAVLVVEQVIVGDLPDEPWRYTLTGSSAFTLPEAGGVYTATQFVASNLSITQTLFPNFATTALCSDGATGRNLVFPQFAPGVNLLRCTFTSKQCTVEQSAFFAFTGGTLNATQGSGLVSVGDGLTRFVGTPGGYLSGSGNPGASFSGFASGATLDTANNDYIQFGADLTGRYNAQLQMFVKRESVSAPRTYALFYSTDGVNFQRFRTAALVNNTLWQSILADLGSIASLNNNPNAAFRLYGFNAAGATARLTVDDIRLAGATDSDCAETGAPLTRADVVTTTEDTPITIPVLANDLVQGNPFNLSSLVTTTNPSNGVVAVISDTIRYTPSSNFSGVDSLAYRICDVTQACATANITITVTAVNNAPVADDASATVAEDEVITIPLSASDAEGSVLTYAIDTPPTFGTVSISGNTATYTPSASYNGADSFTFTASDGGATSVAATVSLTVTADNDAPVASNGGDVVAEDGSVTVTLRASDVEGDALTYAIVSQPAHGTVSVSGNRATYVPTANYNGADSFTFRVNDGGVDSNVATVSLTVTPVNDTPVASNSSVSVAEDGSIAITLSATDIEGDALTYAVSDQPTWGTVSISGAIATYSPARDYNGTDSFTFTASDGSATSNKGAVAITVAARPDLQVRLNLRPVYNTNLAYSGTGGIGNFTVSSDPPFNFRSFNLNDGSYTLSQTPNANYVTSVACDNGATGVNSVTIAVTGNDSRTCTFTNTLLVDLVVTQSVTGTLPEEDWAFTGPGGFTFTLPAAGGVYTFTDLLGNSNLGITQTLPANFTTTAICSNGDRGTNSVSPIPKSGAGQISCVFSSQNQCTVLPATSFDFTSNVLTATIGSGHASVGSGLTAASGTVTGYPQGSGGGALSYTGFAADVTLNPANNDYIQFTADLSGRYNAYLNFAVKRENSSAPRNYTLYASADGVTFAPVLSDVFTNDTIWHLVTLDLSEFGGLNNNPDVTFRLYGYRATSATGRLTLDDVNIIAMSGAGCTDKHAPVVASESYTISEESGLAIDVLAGASDADGDLNASSLVTATNPSHGVVAIGQGGMLHYTPTLNFVGTDSFRYKFCDNGLSCATGAITVTMTAVNDAPVANNGSASVAEDGFITVTLTASDVEGDALTYTLVSTPTHGTLSLSDSTATYTPTADYNGSDNFTFTASDGRLTSTVATVNLTVTSVNDVPVASDGSASVAEDGVITVTLSAADLEGDALTYTIASQPANGTVSVSQNIATYTPTIDYNGSDSFTFTAADSDKSNTAAISLTVTAVNDAPVASNDSITVTEEGVITVTLSASDVEGDALTYAIASQPAHGTVSLSGSTATYTSTANYNGSDSFTFTASDGSLTSIVATISMTVAPANDAPVASAGSATVAEDSVIIVTLSASDIDGDALTYTVASQPDHGMVSVSGSTATYTPTANYNGSDSFTFTANDGSATSNTAAISLTVTASNDTPVADDSSATVAEDGVITVTLRATDVEGDALTYAITSQPAHGVASVSGNTATYTPTANYNGSDSFTFATTDGNAMSNTATISLTVTAINDAPVASDGSVTLAEDGVITITLSASDVDGDVLSYALDTQPAHGTVSVNGSTATYTPTANYNGGDSFTFTVSDGSATSNTATISLTVTAVNDVPVASNGSATVAEDGVSTVTLSATDVDGNALSYAIASQPTHGMVSVSGSTATYTPTANYNGSDSFTFTATNGITTSSAATISLTVTAVNDAPVAGDGTATVAEDGVITVTLTATDVEGSALTYAIDTQPAHGTVSLSGSTATYTPTAGYNGTDNFTFTASDGITTSSAATISLTVTAVNDAPVASAGSVTLAEDGVITVTLSASDVEGDALGHAIATQPAHGTVSVNGSTATYTPTADYNGSDSFTFTASDGSLTSTVATISLTVTAVNDAPVASDGTATVAEDGVITVTLTATDVEGDALTYAIDTQPAHGTVSVSGSTATYTPTAGYNGTDNFTFTASDGSDMSNTATVSITVTTVNDTPVVGEGSATVAEDSVITVTLNASDVDGDALTYALVSTPAHGMVSLSGNTATYTPTADYNGSDSFTFTASDGSLTSTVATISLTVTAINDVPVASDGSVTLAEDGVITVTLTATDVEGSALTYAIATPPAHGAVSVNGSTATYTPTADYHGSDSFTFTASDGSATATAATVNVTVNAAPDLVVVVATQPAYTTTFVYSGTGAIGSFTLPDGGHTQRQLNLSAGSYTLQQAVNTRYSTSVACDDGVSGEHSVTLSLSGDETRTCTFTNIERGNLVVTQVVEGDAPSTDWAFSGPGGVTFTLPAAGGVYTFTELLSTSNLGITQTLPVNFTTQALCSDGATGTTSVFPTLLPGSGQISCVFTSVNQCMVTPAVTFPFTGGSLTAASGTGTVSVGAGLTAASVTNQVSYSGFASGATLTRSHNDYLEVHADLTGRYNIQLKFLVKRESQRNAPRNLAIDLSTDGVTFAPFFNGALPNDTVWNAVNLDLSRLGALNNNPHVTVRIYGFNAAQSTARLSFDDLSLGGALPSTCAEANAPIARGSAITLTEETPTAITLNASDVDGDALTYALVSTPAHGMVSLSGNTATYTPTVDYNGSDSFTFTASDGSLTSTVATISLTVTAINDVPVASDSSVTLAEDGVITVTLTATDGDGDALTYAIASPPVHGAVSLSGSTATYTPTADYHGSDSFTFTASDGSATATATVSITVTAVNDAPQTVLTPTVSSGNATFVFAATDVDSSSVTFTCALDGATPAPCTSPQSYSRLTPGSHTFAVTAIDEAGAADATPASYSWSIAAATLSIVLDAQPEGPTNLGFLSNLGTFILDDASVDDGDAYTNTQTFRIADGSYTVQRNLAATWPTSAISCAPASAAVVRLDQRSATVTLAPNAQVTCTFTVVRAAEIRGRVYHDLVRTGANLGKRNAGDPWLAGWTISARTTPTTVVASGVTTVTAGLAEVTLANLLPGPYTVCPALPAGWTPTDPATLTPGYDLPCKAVTLAPGQSATLLFGAYQPTVKASESPTPAEALLTDEDAIGERPYDPAEDETVTDDGAMRLFLPLINR